MNRLVEQEKALEHSFLHAIGDNNKFKDFLLKVCATKKDQHCVLLYISKLNAGTIEATMLVEVILLIYIKRSIDTTLD